jgi:outer membrane biosynthesis protein TonB
MGQPCHPHLSCKLTIFLESSPNTMKSSAFLALCGGILATASPLLQARKLYTKTDVVVEWVTVTVTDGESSTTFQRPKAHHTPTTMTIIPAPSTTSVAPPPPATTSSTSKVVVQPPPQPTPEPSPEPSTQAAPVVQSPPSVVQVAKVSTSAAPSPAPAKTSSASVAQPSDFQSTALYHHNVHRFNHSAGALEWSDEHAQYAETLAKTCVFEHDT